MARNDLGLAILEAEAIENLAPTAGLRFRF